MEGKEIDSKKYYCTVKEVVQYVGCSENKAYKIMRSMREELIKAGRLTPEYPTGRVPRKYLEERLMIT